MVCTSSDDALYFYEVHDTILNDFQVKEWARNYLCQILKGNNSKMYRKELWFLWSACRLIMLYISMTFHENNFNGSQFIERARFCNRQTYEQTIKAKTRCLRHFKDGVRGWGRHNKTYVPSRIP